MYTIHCTGHVWSIPRLISFTRWPATRESCQTASFVHIRI